MKSKLDFNSRDQVDLAYSSLKFNLKLGMNKVRSEGTGHQNQQLTDNNALQTKANTSFLPMKKMQKESKPFNVKGAWTAEEDWRVLQLVVANGPQKWTLIS